MTRRKFIAGIGIAIALPFVAWAQQGELPLIGFMSGRSAEESAAVLGAFKEGLGESGFDVGRNVLLELRWADGHYDKLLQFAEEFVGRHVAAIAAVGGSVSGLAAKKATSTIPIIFASGGDAVKLGLVPSLNRPAGNVTGINIIFGALGAKRLELLHEIIPSVDTFALLVNPNYPSANDEVASVRAGAQKLALKIVVLNARSEDDFEQAFSAISGEKIGGLLVADDPFLQSRRERLVALASKSAVPTIYFSRDFTDGGGLISYGPSILDAYRLVGVYVGRVLKGERPADLPVIQPTKFELIINLKVARTLGLELPPIILAQADEVIE